MGFSTWALTVERGASGRRGAGGCGSLATAASPWHVLASSRLRAAPHSFWIVLIVPSAAREPRGPSACVPRRRPPRRPSGSTSAPLSAEQTPSREARHPLRTTSTRICQAQHTTCPEGQHQLAHCPKSQPPHGRSPENQHLKSIRASDSNRRARSGARTMPPGRRGGRWRGTQAEGPRGSRAAEGTIRVATKELGVARSRDEASTCHGDAAVARDPQPTAPRRPPTMPPAPRPPANARSTQIPELSSRPPCR